MDQEMLPVKSARILTLKSWALWFHRQSLRIAKSKWGIWFLLITAAIDASFVPLPVTTFFLILILMNPRLTFNYTFFIILGTTIGAIAGYLTGHFAWIKPDGEFTQLAQFLFDKIPGFSLEFYNKIDLLYSKWGIWVLSIATTTPIPYGVFSIFSGVFKINFFLFTLVTIVCQTVKFSILALVSVKSGPRVKKTVIFNRKPAVIITVCLLIIILVSQTI